MTIMIGLDIGEHSIKATLFEGSFGRYTFKRTEQEFLSDSNAPLRSRQHDALHSLLNRIGGGGNNFVCTLPSSQVSVRKISLPFIDRTKIEIALPSLIEEQVPFEIEDVTIQHRVLSMEDNSSEILALIVPTRAIEDHLDYLEDHSINPKHLMVDADALSYYASEGIQAYIDLGASKTICAFYKDGKTLCFRCIPTGISSIGNIQDLNLQDPQTRSQIKPLIDGIRRTLISFEDQFALDTDEVLVSGGGINIPYITDILREELGVPLQKANLPKELSPEWALAYALGKKAAGETQGREFDLRVGSFAYQGHLKRIGQIISLSAVLAFISLIGSVGWYGIQYQELQRKLLLAEENIALEIKKSFPDVPDSVLSSPSTSLSLLQEEIISAHNKLEKLGSIISDTPPTLTLVKELSEGMPSHSQARIDINELVISKTSINIKAETDGFQTATAIETALKQRPLFKQAQKADEKSKRDGIQFSIIIPLPQPEDEETTEEDG